MILFLRDKQLLIDFLRSFLSLIIAFMSPLLTLTVWSKIINKFPNDNNAHWSKKNDDYNYRPAKANQALV